MKRCQSGAEPAGAAGSPKRRIDSNGATGAGAGDPAGANAQAGTAARGVHPLQLGQAIEECMRRYASVIMSFLLLSRSICVCLF
jgi:hypothetical protein